MGVSAALTNNLYATRVVSDTEFKLQAVSERRMAVLDRANQIGQELSNALLTPNPYDDIFWQQENARVHEIDKALQQKVRELETELKAMREIMESSGKQAKENAKKEFTF